jgi:hypothetical protein
MSRPDTEDVFAKKPGVFAWLRDQAYDFVYYEIGAGLDFVGDLFRGPSGYSGSLHRQADKAQARRPKAKSLSKMEQAKFAGLLHRRAREGQVAYWKRKKALLNHPDKKALLKGRQSQEVKAKIVVEANRASSAPVRATKPTHQATQKRGQRR